MTADLVPTSTTAVDRRDVTAEMVTQALVESRQWLSVAMQGTNPTPIAEFKAWAATVEEATRQKNLGKEIQLDAAEMVRRAERGIGVAIRNGQAAGVIAKRGDFGSQPEAGVHGSRSGSKRPGTEHLVSPHVASGATSRRELSETFYALADGVTDEQFDAAITEAKSEGNLFRTNVVRKAKAGTADRTSRSLKADLIADLAARGYSSRQIADHAGVNAERVRDIAREYKVEIPADNTMGRTRHHDSNRISQETVSALEGLAIGAQLVNYDHLNREQAAQWATSLTDSLRVLNRFARQIKEMTQ